MAIKFNAYVSMLAATLTFSSAASAQTLQEAIQHTINTNPVIQSAKADRNAVEQEVWQARSGFLPEIDLAAGYGYEWTNNSTTRIATGKDKWRGFDRTEASIFARQMLFDGFLTDNEVERFKATTDARAYSVFGQSEIIGLEGVRAYLDILRITELLVLAEDNLQVHISTNNRIKLRSERGIGRKADTDQSLGRLDLAERNYLAEAGNLENAKTAFLKIVGVLPGTLEEAPIPLDALPADLDTAIDIAVDNHPVLRSANADINAALAQYEVAKAPFMPRVDLEAGAALNNDIDGIEGKNNDAFAMLRMRYKLFNGGADLARHRETAHLINRAKEIRDETYRQVVESMRLSWVAHKTVESQMNFFKGHAEASIRTNQAYQKQFNIGQRTLLDLLDSANEMFTAKSDYVSAQYGTLLAQYRIMTSMGKLNEYLQVKLPEEATPYTDGTRDNPWFRQMINNESLRLNVF